MADSPLKLAIVVGHEKEKPGAYAIEPISLHEYDYNTGVAQVMYRYAREFGIECKIFLRDKIGLEGCYDQVNEWAKFSHALCIELHFNACDTKARGTEVLFGSDESIDFARLIQETVCILFKRTGKQNRGIKKRLEGRGAKNLALCHVPCALVEPFFGDNKQDALLGQTLKFDYAQLLVECAREVLLDKNKEKTLSSMH